MKQFYFPLPIEYLSAGTTYADHGKGKLDFPAPQGTPIYSMTNGRVQRCYFDSKGNSICEIEPENGYGMNSPSRGGRFTIRYIHGVFSVQTGDIITQGQQIGVVDKLGQATGYHLHIDFQQNGSGMNEQTLANHLNEKRQIIESKMSTWAAESSSNYRGYCWQVMATPGEQKATSTYSGNGTALSPTCQIPTEYANLVFSDRYMGSPNSAAIKALAYSSTREFGFGDQGKSYGKLFRAWILYETYRFNDLPNFRASNATIDTFARYWSGLTGSKWGVYTCYGKEPTQDSAELCQIMYNNIKYPDIYGVTTGYCIQAMSNCPFQNETTGIGSSEIPARNKPLAFSVVERYNNLWYVMYRSANAISQSANPAASV